MRRCVGRKTQALLKRLRHDIFSSPLIVHGRLNDLRIHVTWLEGTGLDELLIHLQAERESIARKIPKGTKNRSLKMLELLLQEVEKFEQKAKAPPSKPGQ